MLADIQTMLDPQSPISAIRTRSTQRFGVGYVPSCHQVVDTVAASYKNAHLRQGKRLWIGVKFGTQDRSLSLRNAEGRKSSLFIECFIT